MNHCTFSVRRKNPGFTLIEVMLASGIAGLVFAAICFTAVFTTRSFLAMGNYADLDKASRNALDIMSRDIRQTRSLTAYQTNQLTFQDSDGGALIYAWDPVAGTLSRIKGVEIKILLTQCDYLNFGVSQRNPSNDFNFYSTTNLSTVKLIDVSWNCSRQIRQQKVNTESVQTAKIVIRN
jgi:prepilin-type N-terminal cleavage/methylation domain-containing protein